MKVALCQFNPVVGAITQNGARLLEFAHKAGKNGADLMLAPELALCGYPPKDLMGNSDFHAACKAQLTQLAEQAPIPTIMGAPDSLYNAAFYCFAGQHQVVARKQLLPNYQVFDDKRYFKPGGYIPPFETGGQGGFSVGITICEDAWNDAEFWPNRRYDLDPVNELVNRDNPDILVTLMASPFEPGKAAIRDAMFSHMAKRYSKPVLVVGQVGANDGLIFEGGSMMIDAQGEIVHRAADFQEDLVICEL